MAHVHAESKEVTATFAVVGAARAGKSAILRCIFDRIAPERRGALAPSGDGPAAGPLMDWLPLDLGRLGGWNVHVHLYAIPMVAHADATRRVVLADADGVLFVSDSQASRLEDNVVALRSLRDQLAERPDPAHDPVTVFLHNKRDLPTELLLTATALDEALNPEGAASFECDALRGLGVLEALHAGVTLVMRRLVPARPAAS
jgi:mutual gliding-motility protein MglA